MLQGLRDLANTLYSLKRTRGDFEGGQGEQLEIENKMLQNLKLRRELSGPSAAERGQISAEQKRRDDQMKSTISMFSDLYRTGSPASKSLLKEQMSSLEYMMTPSEKASVKMISQHTPLNPQIQKALWFEETNPRPKKPYSMKQVNGTWKQVRDETNDREWAEYDIGIAEWELQKSLALKSGNSEQLAEKAKGLFLTSQENIYAFKNPVTKQIDHVALPKDIPQGVWKNAEEKGFGVGMFKAWGGKLPMPGWETGKVTSIGDEQVLVRMVFNALTGKEEIMRTPLGKKDSGEDGTSKITINARAGKVLDLANMKADKETAKDLAYWTEWMSSIEKTKVSKGEVGSVPERAKDLNLFQTRFMERFPGHVPILVDEKVDKHLMDRVFGGYHFEEGRWSVIPADQKAQIIERLPSGEEVPTTLWWNRKKNWWFDSKGRQIEWLDGVEPGAVVQEPNVGTAAQGMGEQRKAIKAKEAVKAIESLNQEVKKQKITVGDMLDSLTSKSSKKQIERALSTKHKVTRQVVIDKETIKLLMAMEKEVRKDAIKALKAIYVDIPKGMWNLLMETPIPGTEK